VDRSGPLVTTTGRSACNNLPTISYKGTVLVEDTILGKSNHDSGIYETLSGAQFCTETDNGEEKEMESDPMINHEMEDDEDIPSPISSIQEEESTTRLPLATTAIVNNFVKALGPSQEGIEITSGSAHRKASRVSDRMSGPEESARDSFTCNGSEIEKRFSLDLEDVTLQQIQRNSVTENGMERTIEDACERAISAVERMNKEENHQIPEMEVPHRDIEDNMIPETGEREGQAHMMAS